MANNYNVTPQEAQELEEKKKKQTQKVQNVVNKVVDSVTSAVGNVVSNWAKPQQTTQQAEQPKIEMPTLKSVEDAYANRKFSASNLVKEGMNKVRKSASDFISDTKSRAKTLETKFPEYKNLTKYGVQSPFEYLASGKDEHKYADYAFDIVRKKHNDYFDSIDTSNAETVSGDIYAKEYGDAYNEALKMRNRAMYDRAETFDRNRQQAVNMWGLPDVTKADGFYNRGTQHVAPSVAKTSLENYSKGGNVDLTDRNVFDGSNIKQFGWDVKDGEAVTTLTNTYTNKDGSVAMNFTPIGKKADGSYFVLTPDELTQYAEAVAEGTREDDLGLKIGKTFEGTNAVKKATEEADRIHTLQEDYYLNGQLNSELNKLDAMTAEHNKGYPWKDTFDYTLDKYVPEQKQEADEKKVNSLADQSRKIAFLFEEQKKTAPASQSADYDKVIKQFKGQADAYDNLSTTLEDYMVNQSYYGYDEKSFNDFKKLESEIRDTVLKNYENPEGLSDKAFASIKNTDGVLANGDMPFDLSAELLTEDAYNKTAMSKNKSYNEYLFEEGYRRLEAINNAIETYNVYYTEKPKTQEDKNRNALYEKLEGARYDVSERMREIADYIDTDARIKAGSAEGMTIDQWNKLEDKPYKTYNEYLYYLGEDKGSAQKRDDMYTAISKVGVLRHDTRFASLSKDEQDKLTSQRNSLTARARGVAEILNSFEEAEKNTNASYKESFGGSFDANYALGWLNDEVRDAWNTYYETGDAEALRGAKAMSKVKEDFVAKHSKALEHDSGWAANLISHSLASYLPQKLSQLESAAPLMLALAPFALPSLELGATTIGGATKLGAAANKAGFIYGNLGTAEAAGSFTYNYRQMRGAAMEALTEEGLSYEDAKPLAHSEALLSSGVELASEVFSVVTLATGKIPGVSKLKDFMGDGIKGVVAGAGDDMLSALGVPQKAASAIKGVVRFGGSYLTSAATEGVEEYIQTDISSANKRIARQIKNAVNGGDVSGLIAETYNVLFRPTKEERAEANESAWEGFKTGLVADGGTGIVIRLANKVDSTIADHRDNIEIGKDIVKNDEQMVTLINAIKFGNKATNKYAEKLVKGLYNGNDVNEAQYGKLAKMTAESYEEAMQNASEYTSPAVPTSSSYTENKGLNDVLNGLNIKAIDEIVSDANLMNEFAKISGVNLYSPVNNPKVNGAVKTVANGGDLNSKAINDILNDSNAMNELEEASGVALTRTSDTSIRQSIRDAVGVLAEESPRMAVAQYATTTALARGAVALQSIGYTKTDAENIMSRYAGEQNPEEVAKLMKAVSMLERDIYTNPEYGLGRFASAKKSAEVLGTAVNLMTNPEAVITRQTLEGFAKAFTDSAKQTNSIGYKNIVSALKEYGFEGNDAEVRQLLYNAVYEGKAEYRGKDFSDNRFVSAFADNLKLFTNSTLAFASSNNPNLTPANMQTVIAINKNNWSDVLQITEDSGIIDSKGSGNNGRKILRQAQKRSSSRSDSGTAERVRKEQEQSADTGRGSRKEERLGGTESQNHSKDEGDSRRVKQVGDYEVSYSDNVSTDTVDEEIQSFLKSRGFRAYAVSDIKLASGKGLEGFSTGRDIYYDAYGSEWQITGHELVHALKRTDPKGYENLKQRIFKGISSNNYNRLVEVYEELYGSVYSKTNDEVIIEEIICDIAGNVLDEINSVKGVAITDDMANAVNEYFDSAVTDSLVEGESGLIEDNDINFDGVEEVAYTPDGEPIAGSFEDGTIKFSKKTYEDYGRAKLEKKLKAEVKAKRLSQQDADDIINAMETVYKICSEYAGSGKYVPFSNWSEAEVIVGKNGKPYMSVVKQNNEYKMNLDFSVLCKKRRNLDAIFSRMIEKGIINSEEFNFTPEQLAQINDIVRRNGFEIACDLCYVEGKRFRQLDVAQTFADEYNKLVKSLVPEGVYIDSFNFGGDLTMEHKEGIETLPDSELDFTEINRLANEKDEDGKQKNAVPNRIARYLKSHPEGRKLLHKGDFFTSKGFEAVSAQHPEILKLYNAKKGSGGPKATFGDVQYMSELLNGQSFNVKKAYAVGGVRLQSFSDYMPRLVFDYCQIVGDMAARGLPAHAYTKEVMFAKQFGLTGIKINMSLIPRLGNSGIPGFDLVDGKLQYTWADESFPVEEAFAIQEAEGYRENCGTIAVGISKEHIEALLDDDRIRMIIPYHKSGINPAVASILNIDGFVDYTLVQNTRYKEDGKKLSVDAAKEVPDFNVLMHEQKLNAREAADAYLKFCDEHNYLPKFDDFRKHPNYYKLLEDFNTIVGEENFPQRGVTATFPDENSAFGSMKDLIKASLEDDAIREAERQNSDKLDAVIDEITTKLELAKEIEAELNATDFNRTSKDDDENNLRIKEYLHQHYPELEVEFVNDKRTGVVRIKKVVDKITTDDSGFKAKIKESGQNTEVDEVKFKVSPEQDAEYLELAKNPEKNDAELREMVLEVAKDSSAMTDDDGDPLILYRGTEGGKTSFPINEGHKGIVYTIDSVNIASNYGDKSGRATAINKQQKGIPSTYALYCFADNVLTIDAEYGVAHDLKVPDELLKYSNGKYKATETEISEWAKKEGYDAVRVDNVRIIGMQVGTEVLVLKDNLLKSADPVTYDDDGNIIPLSKRFNSENQDIRFKVKTPDEWKQEYAQLKKDYNKAIREQTKQLDTIKRLEMETKESKGKILKEVDIKKASKELKEEFFSKIPSDELTERLTEYYKVLNDTSDMDRHMLILMGGVDMAMDIAEDIIEYATESSPSAEFDNEVLKAMRGSYRISEKVLADFGSPEDVKTIKKQLRKYGITLTQNPDAVGIDVKYESLRNDFGVFDDVLTESDMVNAMLQFAEKAKARSESNIFEKNKADMIKQAAYAIFEKNYDIGKVKTYADKVKAEHDAEVAKLKQERFEAEKNARLADRNLQRQKKRNAELSEKLKTTTENDLIDVQKKTLITTGRLVEQKVDTIVSEWVRSGKNLEQASQFIDNISVRYVNGSEVIEETFGTYEEYKRWQRNHPEWKVAEVVAHSNIQQAIANFGSTISSEMADFVSKAYRNKSTKNLTGEQIEELNANKESAITTASERLTKAFNDFMVAGQEHSRGLIKANGDSEIRKAVTKAYKDAYNNFKNEVIEVSKLLNIPASAESLGTFYRKAMERYNASFVKIRNELVGLKGNQDKEKEIRQRFFDLLQSTYKRVGKIKSVSTKGSFTSRTTLNTLLESGNDEQKAIANEVLRIFAEANKQARTFDATRSIRSADVVRFTGKTFETFDELVTEVASMAGDMSMVVPQSLISRMQNAKLKTAFGKSPNTLTLDEVLDNIEVLMQFNRLLETHDKFVGSSVTDSVKDVTKVVLEDIPDRKRGAVNDTLHAWDNLQVYGTMLAGGNKSNPLKAMIDELIAADSIGVGEYIQEATKPMEQFFRSGYINELLGIKKTKTDDYGNVKTFTITAYGSVIGKTQKKSYELTKDMIVALYLANAKNTYEEVIDSDGNKVWKCSDNARHIMDGGITIPGINAYKKGKFYDAFNDEAQGTVRLSPKDIEAITHKYLTGEDKKFADAIYDYFNKFAPERINKVSMELEGVPIAVIEHYFPIAVDSNFLTKMYNKIDENGTSGTDVHNLGSHKQRNEKASTPIKLFGAFETFSRARNNDARYISLAAPISNINKVLMSGTYEFTENGTNRQTVKNAIKGELGSRFYDNMANILKYVQGIKQREYDGKLAKWERRYYQSIFMFNYKSGVSQLSAFGTEVASFGNVASLKGWLHPVQIAQAYKELRKYSSVYVSRAQGDINAEMDFIRKGIKYNNKTGGKIKKGWDKVSQPTVWFDQLVMMRAWVVAKQYGKANIKNKNSRFYGLKPGTDEFMRTVAQKFNEHIINTQPTSAVSTLSSMQLDNKVWAKVINMFQSPTIKMYDMRRCAQLNTTLTYQKMKEAKKLMKAENTEENKQRYEDLKKDYHSALRKWALTELGIFLNDVNFTAIRLAWGKTVNWALGRDDDDDEEKAWWYWLLKDAPSDLITEMLSIHLGMPVVAIKELADFGIDTLTGTGMYNVPFELPASSMVNQSLEGIMGVTKSIINLLNRGEDQEFTPAYLIDNRADYNKYGSIALSSVADVLQVFGIPMNNLEKIYNFGVGMYYKATTDDEDVHKATMQMFGEMPFVKSKSDMYVLKDEYVEKLYKAYREDPESFFDVLKAYTDNPWVDKLKWHYGKYDKGEDKGEFKFKISEEEIIKQVEKKMVREMSDNFEENLKAIYRGETDKVDKTYDGMWRVTLNYQDGTAYMTEDITNLDDLVDRRERILDLYGKDIFDYILGKEYWDEEDNKYPEGIDYISMAKITDNSFDEFLIEKGYREPYVLGSGKDYAQDILDLLMDGDLENAAKAWDVAWDVNDYLVVGDSEENKTLALRNDIGGAWGRYIKDLANERNPKANGNFVVKYKWDDGFYEGELYASTVEEIDLIEKELAKAGITKDTGLKEPYFIYNYDPVNNKLATIGAIEPMKHSGARWYMSAYLNNDINAMKTYIQTAKREGQTESQIEEAVKNVVKGDSGLFRKSWKANSETAMDFCDQIVIEVYEDDGVTQKESEKYYFDSVAEMNKKRKELERDVDENGNKKQAYRNGSSGRHYYSVKAYSYNKNGKLTNAYDYSKIENFMNKALTEGFDMSEEDNWQETATYTNFNPSDKVSYQDKTSYTTTTSITKRGETAKVNKTDAAEDTEQYEDFDVSFDNSSSGGGGGKGKSGGGKGGGGKAKKITVPDYKDYVSEYRKSSRSASSLLKSRKTYSRDELKNRLKEYASPQKTKDVSGRLNYYLTGEDKPKTFEDQFEKYFGK